ncbi:GNAT family N-acetyltransferase [Streptomyces solincola]|uniref:GNAT family N-acetyltransferase n=1 Tax=Streptomyces solincola TaxID=2100817 RepID=A0A2S9Q0I5_9ACTN|nr:GNAT family N-acetyltransferase [Streptomyces solincola]PRH80184.1 GNAT family N-acetyltransferase [Streptomyces solincola]
MDRQTITDIWVRGWALSRGTPAPVVEPWGYRIDVGLPRHVFRHVLPEPDGPAVRHLCETVTTPHAWLKVLAGPEDTARWITPGWTVPDDPGFMMTLDLRPGPAPRPPRGYAVHGTEEDGVLRVRVLGPDGSLAARGQLARAGAGLAVVDQVETSAEHRRRGLGSTVMRTLESAAAAAGTTRAVLAATTDGRALYEAVGWRYRAPLTGIVRTG